MHRGERIMKEIEDRDMGYQVGGSRSVKWQEEMEYRGKGRYLSWFLMGP